MIAAGVRVTDEHGRVIFEIRGEVVPPLARWERELVVDPQPDDRANAERIVQTWLVSVAPRAEDLVAAFAAGLAVERERAGGSWAGSSSAPPSGVNAELTAAADYIERHGLLPHELATPAVRAVTEPLMGSPLERLAAALREAAEATVTGPDEPPSVELPVEPSLVALAWHDVTCPEGPDCRDRPLHAASAQLAHTGMLHSFLVRLGELRLPEDGLEAARRIVAAVPRPTPAEEDAAARDYAETALSEAVAALERIRDGAPDPQRIAGDLLEAHGHAPLSDNVTRLPCPTCTGPSRETVGMVCQTCGTDYGSPPAGRGRDAQDAAAARLWASIHNHPDPTEWHGSCPACGTRGAEAFRLGFRAALTGLADAVTDLCWKATPFGGGESVGAYLLPSGTVHRLIAAAQRAGIPAAFRAIKGPT